MWHARELSDGRRRVEVGSFELELELELEGGRRRVREAGRR